MTPGVFTRPLSYQRTSVSICARCAVIQINAVKQKSAEHNNHQFIILSIIGERKM